MVCGNGISIPCLVEPLLHQPEEGPAHAPLLDRHGPEPAADHHRAVGQLVDTQDLQRFEDLFGPVGIGTQFLAHLLEHLAYPVGILTVGNADIHDGEGKLPGKVLDAGHVAERHHVDRALQVTKANGADRQVLDHAGMPADGHHVPDRDRILDEDEQPGDEVADQGLGPESDRETHHAGARQQRSDVDAEQGEDDQAAEHQQRDQDQAPQQRQQGAGPAALLAFTGAEPCQGCR